MPPPVAPTCDQRDGWRVTASQSRYRNRSGALHAPACTPGSARGLAQLTWRPGSDWDVRIQAKAKRATIAEPIAPLRATVVLGATQAAGDGGACAVGPVLPCVRSGAGAGLRCR